LPRKNGHEEDELEDDDLEDDDDDDIEDEDDDEEDTIDLDSAEEEEDDDDDDDDDDEEEAAKVSVEDLERRRLFQHEAEDILESLTLEDVTEVLLENSLDAKQAPKLKKILTEVIREGDMENMDEAWGEALERLGDV